MCGSLYNKRFHKSTRRKGNWAKLRAGVLSILIHPFLTSPQFWLTPGELLRFLYLSVRKELGK